ncbi:aminotransferase-like domain-containing protein [Acinetobacter sp. WZC-1]|uniref:aminotransferase-like domain-containing protein n=1 Tax=Acinetobacter sp. WZC-1 TaxID=3459034 RepID=UPI00403DFA54
MAMTKIEWTIQVIKNQIATKSLLPGSRLSSVRQFATQLNCSVSTVVEAYARLVSEGVIESRVGSGYYVLGKPSASGFVETETQYDREVDPLWVSRQSLEARQDVLKPGCGWLPLEWMPEQSIRKALKQTARADIHLLISYMEPYGHLGLRQYIARKKENHGLKINTSQILITDSGTQSIDLIFRLLLQPGDIILIDDPCYFNFQALIKAHRLRVITVPFTETGPDLGHFEQALSLKPRVYLTNSGIHNPTGACLSVQNAYQVAKLAEQSGLIIIEDDIFADFEYAPAPRYASFMGFEQVIQIGSYSKTLSASIRSGYVVAHSDIIDKLIDLNIATHFSCSHLNAEIIYQALMDSGYPRHLEWLKKQLIKSMNDAVKRLQNLNIHPWIIPRAGIFLWCRLPEHVDASELSKICLKQGVILAPGSSFSQAGSAGQFMRFNVAQCIDKRIFDVLAEAMQTFQPDLQR